MTRLLEGAGRLTARWQRAGRRRAAENLTNVAQWRKYGAPFPRTTGHTIRGHVANEGERAWQTPT